MKFFRKKYRTDENGGTYCYNWSFRTRTKNPCHCGFVFSITIASYTFGISAGVRLSDLMPRNSKFIQQWRLRHPGFYFDAWHGHTATGWESRMGWQEWQPQDGKWHQWGIWASAHIWSAVLGISVDERHLNGSFGFWHLDRQRSYWSPGFNDHEFPTTDYGRYVCSLSRKEQKKFLAVERALKGAAPMITAVGAQTLSQAPGIFPSIPGNIQPFPASLTTYIQQNQ